MAVHLLSYLKEQFSPAVVDQLSRELNETPATILKAVNGALPTLLGGLALRVQASGGASSVVSFLDKGDYGAIPLDVSQVTDVSQPNVGVTPVGKDFLDQIFGQKLAQTTELISVYSGTTQQTATTILGLAGTILMGVLGRQEQEKGLTVENLKTLLAGQATEFRQALPGGLGSIGSLLGFDELVTHPGPPTEVQGTDNLSGTVLNPNIPKSPEGERETENIRWLRWAVILVAVLVFALIVQKCRQNENSVDGVSTDSTARVESNAVEDTSAATRQSVEDAHGQSADSTAPGPLGIRDSTKTK